MEVFIQHKIINKIKAAFLHNDMESSGSTTYIHPIICGLLFRLYILQCTFTGEADKVYLYHTGPDTCQWVKPEDGSCQDCLVDPDCVEKIVKRLQNEDLGIYTSLQKS